MIRRTDIGSTVIEEMWTRKVRFCMDILYVLILQLQAELSHEDCRCNEFIVAECLRKGHEFVLVCSTSALISKIIDIAYSMRSILRAQCMQRMTHQFTVFANIIPPKLT